MQHINTFTAGMKSGIDFSLFPQDSYLLLRNGTLMKSNHGYVVANIKANMVVHTLATNEYPIASCTFNEVMYVLTITGTTLKLYYRLNDTFETIKNIGSKENPVAFELSSTLFGYTSSKLIEMVAKESYDGSTDLYLCDGLNQNIVINTGYKVSNDVLESTDRFYPSNPDIILFILQKSVELIPDVETNIGVNGNLKPGCYYFYLRYEDESLNSTPFIKEVGPVFIHSKRAGVINNNNTTINKSIQLTISGADTNYKYIGIGVVYLFGEDGILSRENFMLDDRFIIPDTGESLKVNFNSLNNIRTFVLEELFKDNINQNVCETQTQIDGVLYGANWKGYDSNYEFLKQVASLMIPYAVLDTVDNFDKVYEENNNKMEYIEEEMYPLGVSFLIDGRYKTDVFPLCGWYEGQDNGIEIENNLSIEYNPTNHLNNANVTKESSNPIPSTTYVQNLPISVFYDLTGNTGITLSINNALNYDIVVGAKIHYINTSEDDIYVDIEGTILAYQTSVFINLIPLTPDINSDITVVETYSNETEDIITFNLTSPSFIDSYATYDLYISGVLQDSVGLTIYAGETSASLRIVSKGYDVPLSVTYDVSDTYKYTVTLDENLVETKTITLRLTNESGTVDYSKEIAAGSNTCEHIDTTNYTSYEVFGSIDSVSFRIKADCTVSNAVDVVISIKDNFIILFTTTITISENNKYSDWVSYELQNSSKEINIVSSDTLPLNSVVYSIIKEVIEASNNKVEFINSLNNNLGLYSLPKKSVLKSDYTIQDNFKLMGIKVDYEYAFKFISDFVGSKPKITAFYIMQGYRVKNRITQGYSVAAVESVGFEKNFDIGYNGVSGSSTYNIAQSIKLGSKENDCAFPILDGSNVRLFPVIKINRSNTDPNWDYGEDIWRLEQDSLSQMPVLNQGDEMLQPATYKNPIYTAAEERAYYQRTENNKKLFNTDFETIYGNLYSAKFCVFTPDILLDRDMVISDNYFIKPHLSLRNITIRTELPITYPGDDEKEIYSNFSLFHRSSKEVVYANQIFQYPVYKDNFKKILNPIKSEYELPTDYNVHKVESSIINENEISSSFHGFSTRMKSIIEVFGDDMPNGYNTLQSKTITSAFSQTRNQLFNSGILINRFKKNTDDNDNEEPLIRDDSFYSTYSVQLDPFQNMWVVPFTQSRNNNSIPQIVTNLSMKATPYIGTVMIDSTDTPYPGAYGATSGGANYHNFHNTIVNINNFESFEAYKTYVEENYNKLNESYKVILNDYFASDGKDSSIDIFKGDSFSQRTYMRCVKWNHKPVSTYHPLKDADFDYAWKQGQAFNLYLQSSTNSYLRVPSKEETFYPYLLNNGDTEEDFVWKSERIDMLKESWKYNDGYHQIKGIFQLPAFDDIFLAKLNNSPNRIRYSIKHISGSFVDAYREFLVNNYQDFAFENGPIVKLVKYNNQLFSIQEHGILQHYQSQKIQTTGDSSEIILGDRSLLAEDYRQLCEFGTQHKESVEVGDNGIYGVDWSRGIVWRIKPSTTQTGSIAFGIEELTMAKILFNYFDDIKEDSNRVLKQDLYGTTVTGIHTVYDEKNKLILFTFHYTKLINSISTAFNKTLVFSELFDTFVAEYDYNCNMYLKQGSRLFTFNKTTQTIEEVGASTAVVSGLVDNNNVKISPFELQFVITCKSEQDASLFEKEFRAHLITMSPEELSSISWETEYQSSIKTPFINANDFWSNPEYMEHNWRVPVLPNTKQSPIGPIGTTEFNTFEASSQMRGQWLKVKLTYTGTKDIYIKNIITNFIISY